MRHTVLIQRERTLRPVFAFFATCLAVVASPLSRQLSMLLGIMRLQLSRNRLRAASEASTHIGLRPLTCKVTPNVVDLQVRLMVDKRIVRLDFRVRDTEFVKIRGEAPVNLSDLARRLLRSDRDVMRDTVFRMAHSCPDILRKESSNEITATVPSSSLSLA
jgi:hypothetical protein